MEHAAMDMRFNAYKEHKETPKLNGLGIALAITGIILLILLF
jgi:hypothetical protein